MADALTTLARLRHLATEQARRALAATLRAASQADRRHQDETATMAHELAATDMGPGHPLAGSLAAWLPAGQASLARSLTEKNQAGVQANAAQDALAECRAADRAVELVLGQRREEARRAELRREQVMLDDRGGRKVE